MTDITERLRSLYVQHGTDYVQEAADEIERLRNLNTALSHKANAYVIDNARAAEEIERLTAQITAFKEGWMRVIDTEMVITHTGIAEPDDDYLAAKTKLLKLIDWYVSMRTDPAMNGGRQLVPVEPTALMLSVGSQCRISDGSAHDIWDAMITAARRRWTNGKSCFGTTGRGSEIDDR